MSTLKDLPLQFHLISKILKQNKIHNAMSQKINIHSLSENHFTLKDLPAHFHLRLRILKVFVGPHWPFSDFQIPHRLELHKLRVSFWPFCLPYFFRVASGLPQVHHQVLFLQSLLHLLRHNCLSWQNWNFFNVLIEVRSTETTPSLVKGWSVIIYFI